MGITLEGTKKSEIIAEILAAQEAETQEADTQEAENTPDAPGG